MTMRRCEACGGFFDGPQCPYDHSHIEGYIPSLPQPAPYIEVTGRVVRFHWPTSGELVLGVILGDADAEGMVGISLLSEHVRVKLHDVERID